MIYYYRFHELYHFIIINKTFEIIQHKNKSTHFSIIYSLEVMLANRLVYILTGFVWCDAKVVYMCFRNFQQNILAQVGVKYLSVLNMLLQIDGC